MIATEWVTAGRPFVARRRIDGDPAGLLPLGLPLPPSMGKRRIGFCLQPEGVVRVEPPPLLSVAMTAAPAGWQEPIGRLLALDAETRCFGSLAWEHLTGLAYLAPASDLDLLWRPVDEAACRRLLAALALLVPGLPMRLDGEIVAADGTAVQWREALDGTALLMAKSMERVALVEQGAFLAGLAA